MTILHASLGDFLLVDATGSDYERVIVVPERTRLHDTFTTLITVSVHLELEYCQVELISV
jgi:hypothetical protein